MDALLLRDLITVTMTLFAIIDIIGNLPIFIDLYRTWGSIPHIRTTIYSAGFMVAFWLAGDSILALVGIDVHSFAIAGAIVIFIIAIEMILGVHLFKDDGTTGKDSEMSRAMVPLTFPLIAGPGTLTTILSLKAHYNNTIILIGILINMAIIWIVLSLIPRMQKFIKPGFLAVLRRLFGIVLMAIAVKMFLGNLFQLLRSL